MNFVKIIKVAFLLIVFCPFVVEINAQQQVNQRDTLSAEDLENADLAITANVTANELKFEVVPNPTVVFSGKPERKTVWEADRQNLPRPVEPGVTYRNIGIRLRIASRFADIDRIVAEALGEIPISDATPSANQNQTQGSDTEPNASSKETKKKPLVNNRNKKLL